MWEVTLFDASFGGAEVGTFDFPTLPEVGGLTPEGDRVLAILEANPEARTASILVEF